MTDTARLREIGRAAYTLLATLGNPDGAGQERALLDWRDAYHGAAADVRAQADTMLAELRQVADRYR